MLFFKHYPTKLEQNFLPLLGGGEEGVLKHLYRKQNLKRPHLNPPLIGEETTKISCKIFIKPILSSQNASSLYFDVLLKERIPARLNLTI